MRQIGRCSVILLIVFLFLLIPFPAFAHPGGTDSNGGHTDSDTGEYHYHHGYPAHDHYDMDGDGITDCPYDFDDKADRNSNKADVSDTENSLINWKSFFQSALPGIVALIAMICIIIVPIISIFSEDVSILFLSIGLHLFIIAAIYLVLSIIVTFIIGLFI